MVLCRLGTLSVSPPPYFTGSVLLIFRVSDGLKLLCELSAQIG